MAGEEEFFKKNRKKGLAGLLLLLFGGTKRNQLLVLIAVMAGVVATGVAGLTGKLNLGASAPKTKVVSADGLEVEVDAAFEANADGMEKSADEVFSEVERAKLEAATARKVYGGGVPGKARGDKNEAVKFVSRDKKLVGNAEAQHGVENATEGKDYEGASLGKTNGLQGMQGAGSLGMASAGGGSGASFSVSNDKAQTFGSLKNKLGDGPKVTEPRGGSAGGRGFKSQLSNVRAKNLNARVVKSAKKVNMNQGRMGRAMWHLVSAAAQTLVSRCTGCAKESSLLYNRAYATGEFLSGAGIIALPGDAPVAVDSDKMESMMRSFSGHSGTVGDGAVECQEAMAKDGKEIAKLNEQLGKVKWADGPLAQTPRKCCKTKNYNSKVDEYKDICGRLNAKTEAVNKACGYNADQGKANCSQYGKVHECGDLECWLMVIVLIIVVIVLIVITVVTWGTSTILTGALIAGALGALGTALGDLGVFGGG